MENYVRLFPVSGPFFYLKTILLNHILDRANIWQGWYSFRCFNRTEKFVFMLMSYFGIWFVLVFFCLCSKGYFGAVGALLEMLKMTEDQWWSCLKRFLLQMLLDKSESHYKDGNEAITVVLPAGFVNNLKSF